MKILLKMDVIPLSDKEILQIYINIVPFLAEVCGPGCEVALHDVAHPDHSLIAIRNNISGRQIGSPITDLAQDIIDKNAYMDEDYLANYIGRNKNGEFLSSTYYIKNEDRLIGLLCVNKDMTAVQQLSSAFHGLLDRYGLAAPEKSEVSEWLDGSVTDIMRARIAEIIAQSGISPSHMSIQEKIRTVHRLSEDGVMTMKGAVAEIASQLYVSVPTIYRYLNKPAE